MILLKHIMLALAASCAVTVSAQEFDLSSQRSEIQEFNKVPGHNIDRKGIPAVNPTPHSMNVDTKTTVHTGNGFKVKDKKKAFAGDLDFLNISKGKKACPLTIDFGKKQALKAGVKPVTGAYSLSISDKGVEITGFDERGAFYGLQTLRQLLEQNDTSLMAMTVTDWPDMPNRGVVEGFYGTPWSHQVRLSLIDFYGRHKMNNYIYGPKDDPYHSSPHWRQPYPAEQAREISELVEASRRNRVDFVWAIHPGKDIRWDKADYDSLVSKLDMMYDLGVRSFALFFDDIEGIGTDPARQAALVNDLTRDFVHAKGDVTKMMICPTDYSQLWAKPGPEGPLAIYGRDLTPDAEVFWTGAVVCSDLTPETLDFVNSRIKRPALFWWNYPVTDYCRNIILQGPVYGLDTTLTPDQVSGIESNPMEHGEASKLALYGVADYCWNTSAYNPIDNWERGLRELAPRAADAYRTFAIHSSDTETGYRRDESWETVTFPYNDYTPAQFEKLREEFARITRVPEDMNAGMDNKLLLSELKPWLTEFGKIGQRGLRTLDLIKTFEQDNDSIFWSRYVENLMTKADREAYEAHKSGTMKLHPFYENAMDGMLVDFYTKLSGTMPTIYHGAGTYPNLRTTLANLMLDNDTTTYYTSANSQKEGDWIGVDLGMVRPVDEVIVHQGRNSVDDVDYFDHVILESSVDGQKWTALTDSLKQTYIVSYSGAPVDSRYLRLRRLPSSKQNWASVRTFRVNPPSAERIGLNIACSDPQGALLAFDANPATTYTTAGSMSFDRVPAAKKIVVLTSQIAGGPLYLAQFDANGKVLHSDVISTPYVSLSIYPETVRLTLAGTATIHELLQQ